MTCKSRRYADEASAKRCLWAMGQNKKVNIDKLTVKPCKACKGWHVARKAGA